MDLSSLSNYGTAALNTVVSTGRAAISLGGRTFSAGCSGIAARTVPAITKVASGSFGALKATGTLAIAHPIISVFVLIVGAGVIYKYNEGIKNGFAWPGSKAVAIFAFVKAKWDAFTEASPEAVAKANESAAAIEKAESECQDAKNALEKAESECQDANDVLKKASQKYRLALNSFMLKAGIHFDKVRSRETREAQVKCAKVDLARAELRTATSNVNAKTEALKKAKAVATEAEKLADQARKLVADCTSAAKKA